MVKGKKKWANPVFPTRRICVATNTYLLLLYYSVSFVKIIHIYSFILSFIHYDLQHVSFFIHSFSCVYDPVVTGTNMINEEEGDRYLPPTKSVTHTGIHRLASAGFGRFRLVWQVGSLPVRPLPASPAGRAGVSLIELSCASLSYTLHFNFTFVDFKGQTKTTCLSLLKTLCSLLIKVAFKLSIVWVNM